jgi:hypothetical protein
MSPTFEPPTADLLPPTLPNRRAEGIERAAFLLLRHFKSKARGVSVLKIGGTYVNKSYPSQDEIDSATEVYLGGHVYEVSSDVATALEAAGYEVG